MKKSILFIMAAVAMLFTACDPVVDNSTLDPMNYSADELANAVTFKVYTDEACTQEAGAAEGNWVKYTTNPGTPVTILNYNSQGAENILSVGPQGVFKLSPKRGQSNDQELTIRVVNSNNEKVETTKTVSVWVKSDLDPELKLLLGEAGKKTWKWDYDSPTGSTCWGNGGASNGTDYDAARTVGGHWWGVSTPEGLLDQLQHSNTGAASGEEDSNAYMVFDEDGNVATYAADGSKIRGGSYTLSNYDTTRATNGGWAVAKLTTSEPAILFPFSINEGGKTVTDFDVMYLDANHMTLVYTKGNAAGSWGEITHWMFKNATPSTDAIEAAGKWGWDLDGNGCWGNAGCATGAEFNATTVNGKWWGVTAGSELTGQLQHAGGTDYGDADDNAYMIFKDGKVTSYKSDGTEIRSGNYELNIYSDGRSNNWELGKLTTSAPALLFPWSINEGGVSVTDFDIMYYDAEHLCLTYCKGNTPNSWGEITWWRFTTK